ncbi:hypothetical protein F0562_018357 [Nyssa sinensis]|uniref:Uncharacterized protein n=1 Tax=Nyssa sinensis TaxID=561372 RepID=A0A5J4ZCC1_9ASTE|nr:hypothetical protein F0562_018357 [Nyssa sinensis]
MEEVARELRRNIFISEVDREGGWMRIAEAFGEGLELQWRTGRFGDRVLLAMLVNKNFGIRCFKKCSCDTAIFKCLEVVLQAVVMAVNVHNVLFFELKYIL